jgi:hypothetical protein
METVLTIALVAVALIGQVGVFVLYDGQVQEAARKEHTD